MICGCSWKILELVTELSTLGADKGFIEIQVRVPVASMKIM